MRKLMLAIFLMIFFAVPVASAKGQMQALRYALDSGVLSRILAKEMCTCKFVSGLPISQCLRRAGLGMPVFLIKSFVAIEERESEIVVRGNDKTKASLNARAIYRVRKPRLGCVLVD